MSVSPEQIILDAQHFAEGALSRVGEFTDKLSELADSEIPVTQPVIWNWTLFDRSQDALGALRDARPQRPDLPISQATVPAAPALSRVAYPEVAVPEFTGARPALHPPRQPKAQVDEPPAPPAGIGEHFHFPERPAIGLPVKPELLSVTKEDLPELPYYEYPVLTASLPDLQQLVTPTRRFTFEAEHYEPFFLERVCAEVLADLNGLDGSGTLAGQERLVFEKERDRLEGLYRARVEEIKSGHGSLSAFTLPDGALAAQLKAAADDHRAQVSALMRNQALQDFDARRQVRKEALDRALQVEGALRSYHLSMMEMSLNVAKYAFETGLAIHGEEVKRYNLDMEHYRTALAGRAQHYQEITLKLQDYRLRLEAAKDKRELNREAIALYNAQLQSVQTLGSIHEGQVRLVQVYADIERLRLSGYTAQVQAYGAKVQAKHLEFEAYQAALSAEVEKQRAYETELRAYQAQMGGIQAEASLKEANYRAQVENRRLEIEQYRAQMQEYTAKLEKEREEVSRLLQAYHADTTAYGQEAAAIEKAFQLFIHTGQINAQSNMASARQSMDKAKMELLKFDRQAHLKLTAAIKGADVYKNIAAGALSAVNGLAAVTEVIDKSEDS